ncbi:hypothetical protein BKA69DRAFT_1033702 [Paraphysoderma sedebokerense]|nr:hypothetical protein BKA69DRAFT_1033702 [Paraphysoderma sedebokerense]
MSTATGVSSLEDSYNKRLDADIDTLVDGIQDLLAISTIGSKDKYVINQEKLQVQSRVSSIIRASESLLTLSSDLKQSILLNDTTTITVLLAHRAQILASQTMKVRETLELLYSDINKSIEELETVKNSCKVEALSEVD